MEDFVTYELSDNDVVDGGDVSSSVFAAVVPAVVGVRIAFSFLRRVSNSLDKLSDTFSTLYNDCDVCRA